MSLIKKMGLDGVEEKQPQIIVPNTDDRSMSSMSVVVDSKPQLLRVIRPSIDAIAPAPFHLSNNAQFVFNGLLACFRKAGFMKEGIAKDILFGFQVSYPDDMEKVAYGLVDLKRAGYISFKAPDGVETDENCTNLGECWVHYTERMTDYVYGI